jgi:hypothetical protein
VTGKCGSIWVRLIPAPRGTGIVSAPVPKKLLQMAGIEDCYTSAKGSTGTLGNFGMYNLDLAVFHKPTYFFHLFLPEEDKLSLFLPAHSIVCICYL